MKGKNHLETINDLHTHIHTHTKRNKHKNSNLIFCWPENDFDLITQKLRQWLLSLQHEYISSIYHWIEFSTMQSAINRRADSEIVVTAKSRSSHKWCEQIDFQAFIHPGAFIKPFIFVTALMHHTLVQTKLAICRNRTHCHSFHLWINFLHLKICADFELVSEFYNWPQLEQEIWQMAMRRQVDEFPIRNQPVLEYAWRRNIEKPIELYVRIV